jgi:hypothetical protein
VIAMLNLHRQKVGIYKNPSLASESDVDDDTPVEPGDNIVIAFDSGYKKFAVNLSAMTTEELLMWQQAIGIAIEWAAPIVQERDRVAREAADNGNDIFYRRHRAAPKLSVFQRQSRPHAEGVPDGPKDVLAGDGSGPAESGGPGGSGGPVAEH